MSCLKSCLGDASVGSAPPTGCATRHSPQAHAFSSLFIPLHCALFAVRSSSDGHNILLMTDGYKFSHHKQYPVSWMPETARPTEGSPYTPPVLFPGDGSSKGSVILKVLPVPGEGVTKLTIITNLTTATISVTPAGEANPDVTFAGEAVEYAGPRKDAVVLALSTEVHARTGLPAEYAVVSFANVDESKHKRGSALNTFAGGYNVSYFTPRAYKDQFDGLADESTGDHVVFFGLQVMAHTMEAGRSLALATDIAGLP